MNPETIADSKIAVPVADNQFNVNAAASAFFSAATGGPRNTKLCRPATSNLNNEMSLSHFFMSLSPQVKTNKLRITHGNQAIQTCRLLELALGFEPTSIG